jgi:ABC-type transporter Mla MlaB component
MHSHVTVNTAVKIVKIEGQFGVGQIPSLESVFSNDKEYKVLAFNMSKTEWIEFSVLSFLIQILNHSKKIGLEMVLIDVPDPMRYLNFLLWTNFSLSCR